MIDKDKDIELNFHKAYSRYVRFDGRYQDERRVYARTGEPCRVCGTPIKRKVIAQRSAHYCPTCQR